MSDSAPQPGPGVDPDLAALGDDCAADARMFLDSVTVIASGEAPEAALPMGLLALSQVLLMGARLGAIQDIVLTDRYEADPGPDADVERLRAALAAVFEGLDDYADVTDPVIDPTATHGSLSSDLTCVATALTHGLAHHRAGRVDEALWWWQFSYLSDWGERAASALRVVHSLLAHLRLDADVDVVAEAEFDALHPAQPR